KHFGKDTISLMKTAEVIRNLATVAKGIPDMFKGLADAMRMLSDKHSDLQLRNDKNEPVDFSTFFQNNEKNFKDKEKGFPAIMKFIDEVILGTMSEYLGKYDMVALTATASGFVNVVSSTVQIIKSLGDLMGMMGPEIPKPSEVTDSTKAIDRIMALKDDFKKNFESIMKFVKEGIVEVFKNNTIDPADVAKVTSNMRLLTDLFNQLPVFFRSISMLNQTQQPPDMSNVGNYFADLDKLNEGLQKVFKKKRKVTSGLQTYEAEYNAFDEMMGIINKEIMPSMKNIPDTKELETGVAKLEKLGSFMTKLNEVLFQKVAPLFTNRSREDEAIVTKLGKNEELYRGYFDAIARILNDGMMGMMDKMPGPEKLSAVEEKVASSI
ncbi:MAG: hypothetical protein EBS89_13930, partial [Proteobacteria bacterium]|nr:hypothetical protein [Pseudomonadota bacterium]